jgi:hypothetical protein
MSLGIRFATSRSNTLCDTGWRSLGFLSLFGRLLTTLLTAESPFASLAILRAYANALALPAPAPGPATARATSNALSYPFSLFLSLTVLTCLTLRRSGIIY